MVIKIIIFTFLDLFSMMNTYQAMQTYLRFRSALPTSYPLGCISLRTSYFAQPPAGLFFIAAAVPASSGAAAGARLPLRVYCAQIHTVWCP